MKQIKFSADWAVAFGPTQKLLHQSIDATLREDKPHVALWLDWIEEPINLVQLLRDARISLVVVSGGNDIMANPVDPQWVRDIVEQCEDAHIKCVFLGWGEFVPYEHSAQPPFLESQHGDEIDGHSLPDLTDHEEVDGWWWPDPLGPIYRRVGTEKSGHLLDGQEYLDAPDGVVIS